MRYLITRIGIKKSVIFLSATLTAVTVLTVSVLAYRAMRLSIEGNTENLVLGLVQETSKRFDMFVTGVKRMTAVVSFNFTANLDKERRLDTYSQQVEYNNNLTVFDSLLSANNYLARIDVYNFYAKKVISRKNIMVLDTVHNNEHQTIYGLFDKGEYINRLKFQILTRRNVANDKNSMDVFTFVFPVVDNNNLVSGCVATYVKSVHLDNFCADIAKDTGGAAMLINENGEVIAASEIGDLGKTYAQGELKMPCGAAVVDGRKVIFGSAGTMMDGGRFICMVPYDALMNESTKALRGNLILSAMAIMILGLIISLVFNSLLFQPLKRMVELYKSADIAEIPKSGLNDDIGFMLDALSENVARNHQLAKSVYEQEILLKDARIHLFMAQINPHFLYNTLDLIICLLEYGKTEEIKNVVRCMARFYRTGSNVGSGMLTVRQEKENLENYIYIQSVRFQERLSVHTHFPEELMGCVIMKFLLQPIVENAIQYGVEKLDGSGIITIDAVRENDTLVFLITDNGPGIDIDRLRELHDIINNPAPPQKAFYALHNIHWRVKMRYGEPYGIQIDNIPAGGTKVTLRVPIVYDNEGA